VDGGQPGIDWTPSLEEIRQLEKRISPEHGGKPVWQRIRFYSGTMRGGRRMIFGTLWDKSSRLLPSLIEDAGIKGPFDAINIVDVGRVPYILLERHERSCPFLAVSYDVTTGKIAWQRCM
jgi:hypothetical protein